MKGQSSALLVSVELLLLLSGPSSKAYAPGFYEDKASQTEFGHLLKRADMKIFCKVGKTPVDKPPEWEDLQSAKRIAGRQKNKKLVIVWFQTKHASSDSPVPDESLHEITKEERRVKRQILNFRYERVLMVTPTESNAHLGFYIIEDITNHPSSN